MTRRSTWPPEPAAAGGGMAISGVYLLAGGGREAERAQEPAQARAIALDLQRAGGDPGALGQLPEAGAVGVHAHIRLDRSGPVEQLRGAARDAQPELFLADGELVDPLRGRALGALHVRPHGHRGPGRAGARLRILGPRDLA